MKAAAQGGGGNRGAGTNHDNTDPQEFLFADAAESYVTAPLARGTGRLVATAAQFFGDGLADPDPAMRLARWRNLAEKQISIAVCADLATQGFPELARELLRLRGDIR